MNSNRWNYTEFGQLISEVYDREYKQYYCLTTPLNMEGESSVKMEIYDLNKKNQIWKIIKKWIIIIT